MSSASEASVPPAPQTVLVVDDDETTRRIFARILSNEGFACAQAADGEEGVHMAIDLRPDLIVMDVQMPRLGGLEALARIRGDRRIAATPVIFLTGLGDTDSVVQHLRAGGDDYLVKPVRAPEFVARVQLALRRTAELRDLNPLTGLPGNGAILREIARRIGAGTPLACMHIDLDAFKAYNDAYGFARGDLAIKATAEVLMQALDAVPCTQHFAGHIGGDDFLVLTDPTIAEQLAIEITRRFDQAARGLYSPADHERGYIEVQDRRGQLHRTPLMCMSIGISRTDTRALTSPAEIAAVAGEMKAAAKRRPGSAWCIDRRR